MSSSPALQRARSVNRRLGQSSIVAELGVFTGQMTDLLLQLNPTVHIDMIDMWPEGSETPQYYKDTRDFHSNMSKKQQDRYFNMAREVANKSQGRAVIHRGWTTEVVNDFDNASFDLVFIDADHSYEGCKQDIAAWLPKVKDGGWIGGHDYENYSDEFEFGVTQAVKEFINESGLVLELDENYTWFAKV